MVSECEIFSISALNFINLANSKLLSLAHRQKIEKKKGK
jgi:hypothetical protein